MEIEIIVAVGLLLLLGFLAAIDAAFSHISDVGLRRITSDDELGETTRSVKFLREILENRPRFRFALSSTIQVLLIGFTVLLTVIVRHFTESIGRLIFFTLIIGLIATVLFRQILPRLLVRSDTERKLLFLLPAIRPIYAITSFFVEPITSRRTKNKSNADSTITPAPWSSCGASC